MYQGECESKSEVSSNTRYAGVRGGGRGKRESHSCRELRRLQKGPST